MFPGPSFVELVLLEGIDPGHEKAALAVGPQAHIDLVQPPCRRVHREKMDDALPQPQEEHRIVDRARAVGLLKLAGRVVQKDEIEVRSVPKLQAAELAVTRHRHLDRTRRFAALAARGTP